MAALANEYSHLDAKCETDGETPALREYPVGPEGQGRAEKYRDIKYSS